MDFIEAGLNDHNLAIQCHVAGERFPVDIVAKVLRNLCAGVLAKLFREVCSAAILASIFVKGSTRVSEIIAKMTEELSAQLAMVLEWHLGRPAEARRVLAASLGTDDLSNDDWYVVGLIAEGYGVLDVARSAYQRVIENGNIDEPIDTAHLAWARLRSLERGSVQK